MVARNGNIYFGRKRLNQSDNGTGYKTFSLRSRRFYVQIVVCTVYHGAPPHPKMQANHKNGIRYDNRAVNLQWDTSSDNHLHAYRILGREPSRNQSLRTGAKHQRSKPVDQININTGEVIKTFESVIAAAKAMGVVKTTMLYTINKQNGARYCRGYDWKFNHKGNQYKRKYIYYYENGIKKRKLNNQC